MAAVAVINRLAGAGPAGFLGVVAVFLGWVMLTLPTTPLEVGLAYVYGLPTGFGISVFGKTVGSALGFLLCKTVGQRAGWRVPPRLTDQMNKMDKQAHPLMRYRFRVFHHAYVYRLSHPLLSPTAVTSLLYTSPSPRD